MRKIKLLIIVYVLSLLSLSTQAGVDYFLKIEGIDGESTDRLHRGEIDIQSFSWGVSNGGSRASTGTGGGAGKVNVQDISIAKYVDKASPLLMLACAEGKHIKEAVLTARKSGGKSGSVIFLKVTLKDVVVSSYQANGSGAGTFDTVSLSFSSIKIESGNQSGEIDVTEDAAQ